MLTGKRVLITSGPTVEPIDTVRFFSNRSSGKMGAALACAGADAGAEVVVVSGPVHVRYDERVQVIPVQTACEMYDAALIEFPQADVAICAAAVADFRPANPLTGKLKKGIDDAALKRIELVENPDILAALGGAKRFNQVVVGFAAETEDTTEHAFEKLVRKGATFMVANNVSGGDVFGSDKNMATLVFPDRAIELGKLSKLDLARVVLQEVELQL